jgi:hypothetical protein
VEVLHDQLLEHEGQAAACLPAHERICTALIDRDEALQQGGGGGSGEDAHGGVQLGGRGGHHPG